MRTRSLPRRSTIGAGLAAGIFVFASGASLHIALAQDNRLDEQRPGVTVAVPTNMASATAPTTPSSDILTPAGRTKVPLFFGYVEFDFDPDAPGGVWGFGPLPQTGDTEKAASHARAR
jgi:hypothetical protein